jgi:hypothetical protein
MATEMQLRAAQEKVAELSLAVSGEVSRATQGRRKPIGIDLTLPHENPS